MRDDVGEVVLKLLKANMAVSVRVHQGETKLILFVRVSITEHVHDGAELAEDKIVFPFCIEYFKHAVGEEGVTLLA